MKVLHIRINDTSGCTSARHRILIKSVREAGVDPALLVRERVPAIQRSVRIHDVGERSEMGWSAIAG